MQKNGFTLVEMMTVIVILITLGLIAVFSINGIVKKSTEKLYEIQKNNIIDASRTYAVKNSSILTDNNEITLCDLKRSSLLDENLQNPRTEEQFDNSLIIRIVRNNDGDFDFIFDGSTKMDNYYCDLDITVNLNGDSPLYVNLGSSFEELGVTVKRKDLLCTKSNSPISSTVSNCYYTLDSIDGTYGTALSNGKYNKIGTYNEKYHVKSDDFSTTITRTIVVADRTAPTISVNYNETTYTNSFSVRVLEDTTANFSCVATDIYEGNVDCKIQKNDYNNTHIPGTYEIIYKASDSSGNTSTLIANVIVLAKNKNLIVGTQVDNLEWTNESVNLKIFPLYSATNCSKYFYTFDGFNWSNVDTHEITENGNYNLGIRCNSNSSEDIMFYSINNIDVEPPILEESSASVVVTKVGGNLDFTVKNGHYHYYSSESVKISGPSGANDELSGVAGYNIYVNNELFTDEVLTGDGKYEIKISAYDKAGNESEKVLVSYVIISSLKPTCEFLTCDGLDNCNNINPISGSHVIYDNDYRLTTTYFAVSANYKFKCSYNYYDEEEDIFSSKIISNDKFYLLEQDSSTNTVINVSNVTIDASETSNCETGLCQKTNYYTATISMDAIYTAANLYIRENALCDRIGNCNLNYAKSMRLWPKQ